MGQEKIRQDCEELSALLIEILKERGGKITFAESCTAGLLAGTFCSVSGASAVFDGSLVSYANEVKNDLLGVPQKVLATVGAVSEECARAMAQGAAKLFAADLALSVTGIAGPTGGTPEKPVGTVYIGCFYKGKTTVEKHLFGGGRQSVRMQSVLCALRMAYSAATSA